MAIPSVLQTSKSVHGCGAAYALHRYHLGEQRQGCSYSVFRTCGDRALGGGASPEHGQFKIQEAPMEFYPGYRVKLVDDLQDTEKA